MPDIQPEHDADAMQDQKLGTVTILPDEQLLQDYIARIVDQEQLAFSLLYECLLGQVYGLALRITRQVSLAEEVTQDAFWQVWRQAPRFDPERGSVLAWVMTIARSRALDRLRQLEINEIELDDEVLDRLNGSEADNPLVLTGTYQQDQLLTNALMQLDPVPRQLVCLGFWRGLSHEEIADYTGIPLGTVKSHIRRALATLRPLLSADNFIRCRNEE